VRVRNTTNWHTTPSIFQEHAVKPFVEFAARMGIIVLELVGSEGSVLAVDASGRSLRDDDRVRTSGTSTVLPLRAVPRNPL
jgi:hypothetical protein